LWRLAPTDECVGSDNIQSADSENLVRVVGSSLLEHLASDGDRGVDGVGDDGDHSVRADLGGSSRQLGDNRCVGVKQIISRQENEVKTRKLLIKFRL